MTLPFWGLACKLSRNATLQRMPSPGSPRAEHRTTRMSGDVSSSQTSNTRPDPKANSTISSKQAHWASGADCLRLVGNEVPSPICTLSGMTGTPFLHSLRANRKRLRHSFGTPRALKPPGLVHRATAQVQKTVQEQLPDPKH